MFLRSKDFSVPERFLWTDLPSADAELVRRAGSATSDQMASFARSGYAIIPSAVEASLADTLLAEIAFESHNPQTSVQMTYWDKVGKKSEQLSAAKLGMHEAKVLNLHAASEAARALIFSPSMLAFLRDLFGEEPIAFQSLYFEYGSQQGSHNDTAFVPVTPPSRMAASWIALEDVEPGTGELFYYPGSHRLDDQIFANDSKVFDPTDEHAKVYGKTLESLAADHGLARAHFHPSRLDALFWHADLFHGGEAIMRRRTRRSLVTHYCPASSTPKAPRRLVVGAEFNSMRPGSPEAAKSWPATTAILASRFEGENPAPLMQAVADTGFSAESYRRAHQDLHTAFSELDHAFAHFFEYGLTEERQFALHLAPEPARALHALGSERPELTCQILSALCYAHASGIGPQWEGDEVVQTLLPLLALRDIGCRPYLLIGESHSRILKRNVVTDAGWWTPIHLLCSGGSARGLSNPASRSHYSQRLIEAVSAVSAAALSAKTHPVPILMQFGQMDTEFIHMFERARNSKSHFSWDAFREFADESVTSYGRFLSRAFGAEQRRDVSVLSIFPPALSDETLKGGYVNGHILEIEGSGENLAHMIEASKGIDMPDLATRTAMHAAYNARLKAECIKAGFQFSDAFAPFLGSTGLLDPDFIPYGRGTDHHLDMVPTQAVATKLLREILRRH